MGGCSTSERPCYFCREHEKRPLPTGKQWEKSPRCFQVTGLDSGNSPNNTPPCNSGVVARWLQTHTQHLTEMNCPAWVLEVGSCSFFAVHKHLSSGGETMRGEWRGHERGEEVRQGEVTEGATGEISDWKLDLWTSSFPSLQLPVSPSHVMLQQQEGSVLFMSRNGVLFVPPWP